MISELHNKDFFYKENPTFIKYFYKRIRNENELIKEIQLSRLILKFYQKVYDEKQKVINRDIFDYDFFNYGYIEDYGYYTINDGNNGYYIVICYGEDINKAFINIVESIINKNAKESEIKNHREIKRIYKKRFGSPKNYKELYYTNYALSKWNKFYDGNIPNQIVDMYLNKLDSSLKNDITSVNYDKCNNQLLVNKAVKTKKLKK